MAAAKQLLAFDLGAESGRGILGRFDGQRLSLEVVHRFPNGPVRLPDGLYWDILGLYREMLAGLRKCGAEHGGIDALGVDTWGVDFAFLGRGGVLLGNPRHYRDPHTETAMDEALARVPKLEVFRQTGVQFMRINSLYQLLAMQRDRSPLLDSAETLLMVPDLLNYFFTGSKVCEMSDVSTSQMYNPTTKNWAFDLLKSFGLPTHIFGPIVQPGEVLGTLRPAVASEAGVQPVPVVAPGTHDTAAAVAAVPAASQTWAYISSGTWSLMGVELPAPLINEQVLGYNFTNEGGVAGTIRFLKNIMGLWLVQECRRSWERAGKAWSYDELARLAAAAPPFASLVNPDDTAFLLPADMPQALADFCRRTGQSAPQEPGAVVRCALESLALRYRWVLERLEELTGSQLEVIHIVGGGSQNELLCQFTADACNRPVVAGPVEATAIGNLLVQAVGLKLLGSLADARAVVAQSFDVKSYAPRNASAWDEPYQRFLKCIA
ncbi:MAG: rhamnulokinase [Planctomycetia bacterium]|nr:rhamnulokinase [Planctomycetia bacterium]